MNKNEFMSVAIYTDGSCLKNPGGPSGYGYIIKSIAGVTGITYEYNEVDIPDKTEFSGSAGYRVSTANRMELMGIIAALNKLMELKETYPIICATLYSDSKYAVDGTNSWVKTWEKNNWLTSSSKDVLNKDLWMQILDLLRKLDEKGISFICKHIPGHKGIDNNERCDKMAKEAALSPENIDTVYEKEAITK